MKATNYKPLQKKQGGVDPWERWVQHVRLKSQWLNMVVHDLWRSLNWMQKRKKCLYDDKWMLGLRPSILLLVCCLAVGCLLPFFLRQDHPDGGVYVKDLTIMIVKGVRDLQQVMEVPKSDMVLNTWFSDRKKPEGWRKSRGWWGVTFMSKCLLQQWKVVQVLVPLINEFVCFFSASAVQHSH